jgi:hypothetical protein
LARDAAAAAREEAHPHVALRLLATILESVEFDPLQALPDDDLRSALDFTTNIDRSGIGT